MKKEVKILKALGNEKRLLILEALKNSNGLSVADVASEINLHFKGTSKHLQKLVEAGLVEQNREGIWVRQRLNEKVNKLLSAIKNLSY